jgi:hypothetical protein
MLEGRISALHKREIEGRDEFCQYRQSTEINKYCTGLQGRSSDFQEEYARFDDQLKRGLWWMERHTIKNILKEMHRLDKDAMNCNPY